MNSLKITLFKHMTDSQKTFLLLGVPNINSYKLISNYQKNLILHGGSDYNNSSGKFSTNIDGNEYYYKVDRYSPDGDKQFKIIDLITIKDKYKENVHCGSIQIDRKEKIANILSLGNNNKCLLSTNNTKFKYGDILFQIMIHICKKEKVKKIQLTDNSTITCGECDLNLNYLKTITHGYPHYIKYGFKMKNENNPDNDIIKENYDIYLSNPTINKNKLINIIKNKSDDETIKKIIKVINKLENDEISIKKFVKLLMIDLENNNYCKLIYNIYMKLYRHAKYLPLVTNSYELYLD